MPTQNNLQEKILRTAVARSQMPGQYTGSEWNMVRKDPGSVAARICLAFPDTYSLGMSFNGYQILYGLLNERDDIYAERAFAPWTDMHAAMRDEGLPLCSLETFTPISEFDVVGFSLQYEMTFTNVLDMLELGGIPLLAADRDKDAPLIIAGGPCALNPEPMADFIDIFILGEAEERLPEFMDHVIELKDKGLTREELITELAARVPNTYAPSLYDVVWNDDGTLKSLAPKASVADRIPAQITQAVVADLETAYLPTRPIVPFNEIVHDRINIEIMRGCWRGCRYCHAGMTRRPVRYRSVETILKNAEAQYAATGYSQIALTSLSTSDYPDIHRLVRELVEQFKDRRVSISLPSLRVNDQLGDLPAMLSGMKKSTLTIAPEAATERLRRVINKDILDEDLFNGVRAAYEQGWNGVKLYFMAGLPTETDEDLIGIAKLAEKVSHLRREVTKGAGKVNMSVAGFVPKPHTPFQRAAMATKERLEQIHPLLRQQIRTRAVSLNVHRADRSFLEGVFARGDRRLGKLILKAHELGCRFDAWDETFNFTKWEAAFEATGIDGTFYANRARADDELLPWSHISAGVSHDFLAREAARSQEGEFTPDCRDGKCQACGVEVCKETPKAPAS
jgi:radical SAM family uncharacterized protein